MDSEVTNGIALSAEGKYFAMTHVSSRRETTANEGLSNCLRAFLRNPKTEMLHVALPADMQQTVDMRGLRRCDLVLNAVLFLSISIHINHQGNIRHGIQEMFTMWSIASDTAAVKHNLRLTLPLFVGRIEC